MSHVKGYEIVYLIVGLYFRGSTWCLDRLSEAGDDRLQLARPLNKARRPCEVRFITTTLYKIHSLTHSSLVDHRRW